MTPPIADLIQSCQKESQFRSLLEPPGTACWTLFCLAVEENNQQAWQAVRQQYYKMIIHWGVLYQSPLEADELVNDVFTRFFKATQGHDIRQKFGSLPSLLTYLQRCTYSAVQEAHRKRAKQQQLQAAFTAQHAPPHQPSHRYLEQTVLDRLAFDDCYGVIQKYLKDDDERLVFELCILQELKPSEIVEQNPNRFPEAHKVYRVKERFLDRLRHNDMILQLCK